MRRTGRRNCRSGGCDTGWTWNGSWYREEKAEAGCWRLQSGKNSLLDRLDCKNGYSLYVGIPFCPSICAYCSFSSSPIALWEDRTDRYLDASAGRTGICGESFRRETYWIRSTWAAERRRHLRADQLDRLLTQSRRHFL